VRMKLDLSYARSVRLAVTVVAIAMGLYHMWVIVAGPPEAIVFRGTHLLFALTLVFLLYRRRAAWQGQQPTTGDYALLILGAASILYLFLNYEYVVTRIYYIDDLRPADIVFGTILTLIVLEATRRVLDLSLPITAILFVLYGLFIARLEPLRMLDQLYLTTEGLFGQALGVSASFVLIFVLFGSFMERTGTGQLFMDFAMAITGHTAGGPGKVSVVSSSLFGTISGSAVANVMVDGPISIPLMKRSGFPAHFAAGVEATASTGGQIMPPVMGAAAFVMAEFLAVPYSQVVVWAVLPAVLYYVACFAAVHFEARRRGLLGVPRAELPRLSIVLRQRGHLFVPIIAILFVMYSGYSAPLAALVGTMLCFPVAWFGPLVLLIVPVLKILPLLFPALVPNVIPAILGLNPGTEAGLWTALIAAWAWFGRHGTVLLPIRPYDVVAAFEEGAKNALAVALACAAAGIMIGVVTLSGLGIVFTQWVVALAQETLLLALVMTMLAGIVLGTGLPTTPSYIIMTALLVPAIMKLGVVEPAAHMFAFYYAVLSAITPPVALAVFAAAGLAKADMWDSGWAAMKIGAAGFIVPFMFAYQPALLMIGDWPTIIWSFATAGVGITLLAGGLHGYFVTVASYWQRMLLVGGGFCLVVPGLWTDLAGAVLGGVVIASQVLARSSARAPETRKAN
jgi:TRAP transporter 4TM/12TM fusion protein